MYIVIMCIDEIFIRCSVCKTLLRIIIIYTYIHLLMLLCLFGVFRKE